MKRLTLIFILACLIACMKNQQSETEQDSANATQVKKEVSPLDPDHPKEGEYLFDISFAEWHGKSMDEQVKVVIEGDSVTVIYAGGGNMMAVRKGTILEKGLLIHHQSGEWIIAEDPAEKNADPIGGCSGGPNVLHIKEKKYETC